LTSTKRWNNVLSLSQGQIRIALYLVHHGNQASKTEIITALTTQGKDNRKPESIERMIYQMKARSILKEDREGTLRLQNPRRYQFVIKWVRGSLLDRWVLLPLPLYLLGLIMFQESLTRVFIILLAILHCVMLVDDYFHVQKW
jgi:hypothetical protein